MSGWGASPATSLDRLLGGRITIRQFRSGHRAGSDAVLLGASIDRSARAIADLGAGVGTAGIIAAGFAPEASLLLAEIDPQTAALARENCERNRLGHRARVVEVDLTAPARQREAAGLLARSADLVVMNPPFAEAGKGRSSPDPARRRAHEFGPGDLDRWIRAAAHLLEPAGSLVLIHRADALADLLPAMLSRFGALRLIFVHAEAEGPAIRVLVRGRLASRAPLEILPPMVLHEPDKTFTAAAEDLHHGRATIDWQSGRLVPV